MARAGCLKFARRALLQGALAVGVLLAGLLLVRLGLAAFALDGRSTGPCPTAPPNEQGRCLLAQVPAADFAIEVPAQVHVNYTARVYPVPFLGPGFSTDRSAPLPDWWFHAFYSVALPLHGWQPVGVPDPNVSPDSGERRADYCRPDSCVTVTTLRTVPGYDLMLWTR
jgi:hypothetical protein